MGPTDILSLAVLIVIGIFGAIVLFVIAAMIFAAPAMLAGKLAEMIARKFMK